MRKIIFPILALSVLVSCSKEDDVDNNMMNEVVQNELKLEKVYVDGNLQSDYEYFEDNRLKKRTSYNANGEIEQETNVEYDGDTIIEYVTSNFGNTPNSSTNKYYQISANQSIVENYDSENQLMSHIMYNFDGGNCGNSSYIVGLPGFEEFNIESSFQYTDDNCSYERYSVGANDELVLQEVVTNDDKNSANKSTIYDFYRIETPRNMLSLVDYDSNGEVSETTTFTYAYNDDNYPTSLLIESTDGESSTLTFEYY